MNHTHLIQDERYQMQVIAKTPSLHYSIATNPRSAGSLPAIVDYTVIARSRRSRWPMPVNPTVPMRRAWTKTSGRLPRPSSANSGARSRSRVFSRPMATRNRPRNHLPVRLCRQSGRRFALATIFAVKRRAASACGKHDRRRHPGTSFHRATSSGGEQCSRVGPLGGRHSHRCQHCQAIVSLAERKSRPIPCWRRWSASPLPPLAMLLTACWNPLRHGFARSPPTTPKSLRSMPLSPNSLMRASISPTPMHHEMRSTNENTNGLIRQYFTKSRHFDTITQQEIDSLCTD